MPTLTQNKNFTIRLDAKVKDEAERRDIALFQRKIAREILKLGDNYQDSYLITINQMRNVSEEKRRRNTVFTKEQMRPTKWSTDDPIFISAFDAL